MNLAAPRLSEEAFVRANATLRRMRTASGHPKRMSKADFAAWMMKIHELDDDKPLKEVL